jgi:hypothetical protein
MSAAMREKTRLRFKMPASLIEAMVKRRQAARTPLPSDPLAIYRAGVEDAATILAQHFIKSFGAEACEGMGWAFDD